MLCLRHALSPHCRLIAVVELLVSIKSGSGYSGVLQPLRGLPEVEDAPFTSAHLRVPIPMSTRQPCPDIQSVGIVLSSGPECCSYDSKVDNCTSKN